MPKENQSTISTKERYTISAITGGFVFAYYNHNLTENTTFQTATFFIALATIAIGFSVFFKFFQKKYK